MRRIPYYHPNRAKPAKFYCREIKLIYSSIGWTLTPKSRSKYDTLPIKFIFLNKHGDWLCKKDERATMEHICTSGS